RTIGPPFLACGLNLGVQLRFGQGRQVEGRQPIRGRKQLLLLPASDGISEQTLQHLGLKQTDSLRLLCHGFRQGYSEFHSRHVPCLTVVPERDSTLETLAALQRTCQTRVAPAC